MVARTQDPYHSLIKGRIYFLKYVTENTAAAAGRHNQHARARRLMARSVKTDIHLRAFQLQQLQYVLVLHMPVLALLCTRLNNVSHPLLLIISDVAHR